MIGKVVGSYKIVEKIGEGGMGSVYRAVDVMLEREAAIKAIRPDLTREPQIVERFRAEAKTLARLHHPAIAMIYSFFHEGGDLYLAMEFVHGRPLSEVLREEGRLPWERAVPLLASALDGIEQAHRIGVIHRDLKPDNLMLTPAGTLKVMDFGIARVVGSSHLTRTGLLVGTLRYMAPEQIRGEEVGRATDIYSLGIVLYEMVTGRTPFQGGSDYAILRAQIEDPPAPPSQTVPGLPGWIDEVILKALAKEPAARFQSVAELHAALARHAALSTLPSPLGAGFGAPAGSIPTPPPVAPAVSEPVSQATRPDRLASGADQQPTMATGPKSLPTGSAAIPVSPPPTGAGSYRPMGSGKGKHLLVTAAVVLLIAMAGAGTVVWVQGRHAAEPTAAAALPEPSPTTLGTEPALSPSPSPSPVTAPADDEPRPVSVPPPAPTRPSTRTQLPPPVETRPSPSPTPAPEEREPAAAEPVPAEEPEAPAGTAEEQEMLPLEEIRKLAGELKTESARLYVLYEAFLEGKEDGGAELTPEDEQLLEELEHFEDAAAAFNGQLKGGFLGRVRGRRPGGGDRPELRSRLRTLVERGQRVDRLMAQVQPGPEVQQSWQGVRRRWQRVGAIVGGGG